MLHFVDMWAVSVRFFLSIRSRDPENSSFNHARFAARGRRNLKIASRIALCESDTKAVFWETLSPVYSLRKFVCHGVAKKICGREEEGSAINLQPR